MSQSVACHRRNPSATSVRLLLSGNGVTSRLWAVPRRRRRSRGCCEASSQVRADVITQCWRPLPVWLGTSSNGSVVVLVVAVRRAGDSELVGPAGAAQLAGAEARGARRAAEVQRGAAAIGNVPAVPASSTLSASLSRMPETMCTQVHKQARLCNTLPHCTATTKVFDGTRRAADRSHSYHACQPTHAPAPFECCARKAAMQAAQLHFSHISSHLESGHQDTRHTCGLTGRA